jgi:nicotinamide-nucleotide amidase
MGRGAPPDCVSIIIVGDELLAGSIRDRNGAALAAAATSRGGRVLEIHAVPDDSESIRAAVEAASDRCAVILIAGGLGPTPDDLTREGVAAALERPLCESTEWSEQLDEWMAAGYLTPGTTNKQSLLPEGAQLVRNPYGTASCFVVRWDGGTLLALPGVPAEVTALLAGDAGALLEEWLDGAVTPQRRVRLIGVPESHASARSARLAELQSLEVAYYVHGATVDVVVRAPSEIRSPTEDRTAGLAEAELAEAEVALGREFGDDVYEIGDRSLAEVVLDDLRAAGQTVSVAESCTGGYLSQALTAVSGASDVFWGGVVSYADEAKLSLLGVPDELLATHGAVSEQAARAMAAGMRSTSRTTWSVATTGVAGPSGGSPDKPVGTVWFALDGPLKSARKRVLRGDREAVRARAVQLALDMLRRAIEGEASA